MTDIPFDSAEGMRAALKRLVETGDVVTLDAKSLRAMFSGKKAAREWAAANGLKVERTDGSAVFKRAA